MRYLYTTNPDEGCHEFEEGIFGRPAQTSEEPKLRKLGWTLSIDEQRGTDHVREEKEGREEEGKIGRKTVELDIPEDPLERSLRNEYYQRFGKKAHHKAKVETLKKKLGY